MYLKKRKKGGLKKHYYSFIPTILLSLFLIFTVVLLTGMGGMLPKRAIGIYIDGYYVGDTFYIGEKNNNKYYPNVVSDVSDYLKFKQFPELQEKDFVNISEKDGKLICEIYRAFDVKAKIFGESKNFKCQYGQTVEGLLKENGINTDDGNILIDPDKNTLLPKDDNFCISVKKLEKKSVGEEQQEIKYNTKEEKDPNKLQGEKEVKQKGVNGTKKVYTEQTLIDGVVEKEEKKEDVINAPVDEIVLVGTKQKNENKVKKQKEGKKNKKNSINKFTRPRSKPVGPSVNRPTLGNKIFNITAYSGGGQRGASGKILAAGKSAAVNPNLGIPIGSHIKIGDKIYTIEDRMSKHARADFDVCLGSRKECINWGRRNVPVQILGK